LYLTIVFHQQGTMLIDTSFNALYSLLPYLQNNCLIAVLIQSPPVSQESLESVRLKLGQGFE